MTEEERKMMEYQLILVTSWNEEYIKKCSDDELRDLYKERVLNR